MPHHRPPSLPQQGQGISPYERRIARVIDYIHHADPDQLSLDHLADVAALSRFHFHRVFHGLTGETAIQATRRIRLNQAAVALARGDQTMEIIAHHAGYATVPAFSRAFRASFGRPPSQFRKMAVARAQIYPRAALSQPNSGENLMYDITIENEPNRTLALMPHQGDYLKIAPVFEQLNLLASTRDLWSNIEGMLGVYYDDPDTVAADDLRSAAALVLKQEQPVEAPLQLDHLKGGRTAVLLFKGPYAGLHAAYKFFYSTWLAQSGEELRDAPPYELYVNSPSETAPEDLLTRICIPLADRKLG